MSAVGTANSLGYPEDSWSKEALLARIPYLLWFSAPVDLFGSSVSPFAYGSGRVIASGGRGFLLRVIISSFRMLSLC